MSDFSPLMARFAFGGKEISNSTPFYITRFNIGIVKLTPKVLYVILEKTASLVPLRNTSLEFPKCNHFLDL